jgi:PST family polysaccharide transporter
VSSVGERATRGAAWNVVGSVATRVITLAGTLLLTRFIAPKEYGEVSAASVCIITATTFSNLKFGQYIIAKKTGPDIGFQAAVVHVLLGFLAVGAVLLLREPLGLVVDAPGMVRFVPGLALAAFVERFAHVPERTLVRDLRFR